MTGIKWWTLLALFSLVWTSPSQAAMTAPGKHVQICIPQPLNDTEVMALSRKDRQIYVRRVHNALIPLVDLEHRITADTPTATSSRIRELISKFSWIERVYAEAEAPLPELSAADLEDRCDS